MRKEEWLRGEGRRPYMKVDGEEEDKGPGTYCRRSKEV